jgi:hypothetical protein
MAGRPTSLEAKRIEYINKSFLAGLKSNTSSRRNPHIKRALIDAFEALKTKNNTRTRNAVPPNRGANIKSRSANRRATLNAKNKKKELLSKLMRDNAEKLDKKIKKNKKEVQKQKALVRTNGEIFGAASSAQVNALLNNAAGAHGNGNNANALPAHANGNGNNAAGAHGNGNNANALPAHANGNGNNAVGAHGNGNNAVGAHGNSNNEEGSHGNGNNANALPAHANGNGNNANALPAHANGNGNNAAGAHANDNGNSNANEEAEPNIPLGLESKVYEVLEPANKIVALEKEIEQQEKAYNKLIEMMQRLQTGNATNPWLRPRPDK